MVKAWTSWTYGVVNFKDPVKGPLIGNDSFLHYLVLAEEWMHCLVLLRLVLQMLEVAAVIYNSDVTVIKVHDSAVSRSRSYGAFCVCAMLLRLGEM